MMGSGSGAGGAAREQRALEEERQRRVNEGVARVNAIFSGGKYGTGAVSPMAAEYGKQYYDLSGNPTTLQPQYRTIPGQPTYYGPHGTARRPDRQELIPASTIARGGFGRSPMQLYSGVGESEGYTDQYFDNIADAYTAYYTPQLEEQFGRSKRDLTLNSPNQGSGYLRNLGDLATDYQRQRVALGERAQGARADAKRDVETNRAALIRAAEGGSAPDVVANQAVEASKYLRQPPAYEPLGDVFSRAAMTIANLKNAQRAGYEFREPPLFFNPSSRKRSAATTVG